MEQISEFSKKCVLDCYMKMKDYIRSEKVEEEECFYSIVEEIEKLQIAIPEEISTKITDFVEVNLHPIVDNPDIFADVRRSELGRVNESGAFEFYSEESAKKACMIFMKIIAEIDIKLTKFGVEELSPYLV